MSAARDLVIIAGRVVIISGMRGFIVGLRVIIVGRVDFIFGRQRCVDDVWAARQRRTTKLRTYNRERALQAACPTRRYEV